MIWLIFVALEIARNYILIEVLNKRPHYGWSARLRIIFGALFFIYYVPDPANMIAWAITYALFQMSSFYIFFDLILNLLRKKPIFYRGKNSGKLDKLPDGKYYLLKAGSLVVMILSLIVMIWRD